MSRRETKEEFLNKLFEWEYCAECGGDKQHHKAVGVLGNWFAVCLYPYDTTKDEQHPVIQEFRERESV